MKEVYNDIKNGEVGLDTALAGISLLPFGKRLKIPKVVKAVDKIEPALK